MLVLTRRIGEEIVIDGNIRIKVLLTKGDRVRIGVTAPDTVRIDREEVHERRSEFATAQEANPPRHAKADGRPNRMRKNVAVSPAFCQPFDRLTSIGHGI